MELCPCGTEKAFEECCGPLINGDVKATTAEQLMRSRYSAYAKVAIDYVHDTTHPEHRDDFDLSASRKWAESSTWEGMEIVATEDGGEDDQVGKVEFVARYTQKGEHHKHHELSTFEKVDDTWYFVDGQGVKPKQFVREQPKRKPNDPCVCGSGRKFKKCCMGKV